MSSIINCLLLTLAHLLFSISSFNSCLFHLYCCIGNPTTTWLTLSLELLYIALNNNGSVLSFLLLFQSVENSPPPKNIVFSLYITLFSSVKLVSENLLKKFTFSDV